MTAALSSLIRRLVSPPCLERHSVRRPMSSNTSLMISRTLKTITSLSTSSPSSEKLKWVSVLYLGKPLSSSLSKKLKSFDFQAFYYNICTVSSIFCTHKDPAPLPGREVCLSLALFKFQIIWLYIFIIFLHIFNLFLVLCRRKARNFPSPRTRIIRRA